MKKNYIDGWIDTEVGNVPKIKTILDLKDRLGTLMARLTINRMDYKIDPGLYAAGNPGADSMILVSANYKMSFDTLRSQLNGINAWIMVLDTKGINVWCSAGKGTFGTEEIVNRIKNTGLKKIIKHRNLIVPQLGATGVAAHEVKKLSGFNVIYGPVRASDLSRFVNNNLQATPEMRRVSFPFRDRLILVPAETVTGKYYLLFVIVLFFLLSGFNRNGYSVNLVLSKGFYSIINVLLAFLAGSVIGPLLLPWLPGRSFSMKGFFAGAGLFIFAFLTGLIGKNIVEITAWLLLFTGISSFVTMNFTGASTYTSLSGVVKEMKTALPLQLAAVITGTVLWIAGRFI